MEFPKSGVKIIYKTEDGKLYMMLSADLKRCEACGIEVIDGYAYDGTYDTKEIKEYVSNHKGVKKETNKMLILL